MDELISFSIMWVVLGATMALWLQLDTAQLRDRAALNAQQHTLNTLQQWAYRLKTHGQWQCPKGTPEPASWLQIYPKNLAPSFAHEPASDILVIQQCDPKMPHKHVPVAYYLMHASDHHAAASRHNLVVHKRGGLRRIWQSGIRTIQIIAHDRTGNLIPPNSVIGSHLIGAIELAISSCTQQTGAADKCHTWRRFVYLPKGRRPRGSVAIQAR